MKLGEEKPNTEVRLAFIQAYGILIDDNNNNNIMCEVNTGMWYKSLIEKINIYSTFWPYLSTISE